MGNNVMRMISQKCQVKHGFFKISPLQVILLVSIITNLKTRPSGERFSFLATKPFHHLTLKSD